MPAVPLRIVRPALALALAVLPPLAEPARAESVGTAGAANVVSSGTPPGGAVRTIQIGEQIVRNEKINTSTTGSVQVAFIDKTSLNIGPNSTLVIDEFVFSPAAASGKLTLSLAKGLLRVVGGQATHTGGAEVITPVATIGIRGGIATIGYCASASAGCRQAGLRVTNHFGQITVTTAGGATQTISRPGFTLTVGLDGAPSGSPFRATQAEVNADNTQLTSNTGQSGGSSTIPTDTTGQRAGLGRSDALLNPTLSVPRQGQTIASAQVRPVDAAGSTFSAIGNRLIQTAQVQPAAASVAGGAPAAQNGTGSGGAPPAATQPTAPTTYSTLPARAYALTTTVDQANLGQGQVPYLLASFIGQGTWNVSQILAYRAGGTRTTPFQSTTSRFLQAGINVNGTGSGQNSGLFVATGDVTYDNQYGFTYFGGVEALARGSSTSNVKRSGGSLSSPANTASASAGSVPVDANLLPTGSFATNQNGFTTDNTNNVHYYTPQTASSNGGVTYQFNQTVSTATTPAGLGADHPGETLQGFVGGLAQTTHFAPITANGTNPASPFVITNATGSPGDVSIVLAGNSSRAGATFNIVNATPSQGDVLGTATLNFGYLKSNDDGVRGTYVDSRNFGARSERTFDASTGVGIDTETSTINGQSVIVDPNNDSFHLEMVTSDTVLGTSATVHTSSVFPGVTFCACDYTRWGFWSGRSYQQDTAANTGDATASNLATWVAGLPSGASDIPTIGTASYTGHVIASIYNNGANYISAGNFTNNVNFATGVGAVVVPNLDGATYSGNVAFNTANRALFSGSVPGFAQSARTMALTGTFYQSATSPYGEMGGSVKLSGANYLGGGIFAAHGR